jgi:hypothetical protein
VIAVATHGEWTTADYALIVSVVSLFFAVASFVWNVWSKFISPKPKIRVAATFALYESATGSIHYFPSSKSGLNRMGSVELSMPAIQVYVANHGPGNADIGTPAFSRKKPHQPRKQGYELFNEFVSYPWQLLRDDDRDTFTRPLNFGESRTFYIPVDMSELNEWQLERICVIDAFGRKHFCSKADMAHLEKVAEKFFAKATQ